METLFENKYTQDKEWAKDLYSYLYFRRPSIIVLDVLFATYLILGIYNSITTGSVDWYFISIPIVYYASIVFMYCRNVDIAIKRDLELHGKVIEITVTAAEDIIKEIKYYQETKMADFEKNPELEEELDENIITLTDEDTGEEQDFEIWAQATIDEKIYFALVPVDDEGDEYVILRATVDGDDLVFETIDDDDEFEKAEDYFNDLLFSEVDYDEN